MEKVWLVKLLLLHTMKVTCLFRLLVCTWLYDRRDILFIVCIIFGQLGRLEMRFSILFFFGSEASISLLRQELNINFDNLDKYLTMALITRRAVFSLSRRAAEDDSCYAVTSTSRLHIH